MKRSRLGAFGIYCLLPTALCLLSAIGCGRSDSGPPPGAPTDTPEMNVSLEPPTEPKPEAEKKGAP
jgi:hypothetical protein